MPDAQGTVSQSVKHGGKHTSSQTASMNAVPKAEGLAQHTSYSHSGVNLLEILIRVAKRSAPKVDVGPIDLSCPLSLARVEQTPPPHTPSIVFHDASDEFLRLVGLTRDQVVGQTPTFVFRFARPEQRSAQEMYVAAANGAEQQACLQLVSPSEIPCRTLMTLIPLRHGLENDASGEGPVEWIVGFQARVAPDFALCGNSDMPKEPSSPLRRAVEVLSKETPQNDTNAMSDMFQLNVDNDTLHFVSLRDTLQYVSQSVQQLLGYQPSELVGKPIQELCDPNDTVALLRELKEVKTSGSRGMSRKGSGHSDTGQEESLFSLLVKPDKPPNSRANFPVKPVRLDENVSRQTTLAEVNGLLRMKHKSSELVWMETSARLVLLPGGAGRKGRKVVAVSGRRRKNYFSDAMEAASAPAPAPAPVAAPAPKPVGDPVPAPTAAPAPSSRTTVSTPFRKPPTRSTWLVLSATGVILQCHVQSENTESSAETSDIPVRIGFVLANIMDSKAVHEVEYAMQNTTQRPMSIATWIAQTPVIATWVPLTPNLMRPPLIRMGARMLVRLDARHEGHDRPTNTLFAPDPRSLVIPKGLTHGMDEHTPSDAFSTQAHPGVQPDPSAMHTHSRRRTNSSNNESFWSKEEDRAWKRYTNRLAPSADHDTVFPSSTQPTLWASAPLSRPPIEAPVSLPTLPSTPEPEGVQASMPELDMFHTAPFTTQVSPGLPSSGLLQPDYLPANTMVSTTSTTTDPTLPTSLVGLTATDFPASVPSAEEPLATAASEGPFTTVSSMPHAESTASSQPSWPLHTYD